jgi:hypothetical protein
MNTLLRGRKQKNHVEDFKMSTTPQSLEVKNQIVIYASSVMRLSLATLAHFPEAMMAKCYLMHCLGGA